MCENMNQVMQYGHYTPNHYQSNIQPSYGNGHFDYPNNPLVMQTYNTYTPYTPTNTYHQQQHQQQKQQQQHQQQQPQREFHEMLADYNKMVTENRDLKKTIEGLQQQLFCDDLIDINADETSGKNL